MRAARAHGQSSPVGPRRFAPGFLGSMFILVFVLVGAYSVNNSVFDLGVTVVFGLLGYVMRRLDFEPAPLVLAMILGPQLEAALRRSLIYSRGDLLVFFQRPISAVLLALAVAMLASPGLRRVLGRRFREIVRPAPG